MIRHRKRLSSTCLNLGWCLLLIVAAGCSKNATAPSGSRSRQLTTGSTDMYPSWSPDGKEIAFSSHRSGSWAIWIVALSDSGAHQRTPDSLEALGCSWSPDGRSLAFSSFATGLGDIWTIPDSGGVATRITRDPGSEFRPAWSRDGKTIAYISSPTAASDESALMLVAVNGTSPSVLLTANTVLDTPSWYLDSKQIAVSRPAGIRSDLLIVVVAGGLQTVLTGIGPCYQASWNYAGTHFAYSIQDDMYPMLGVMTVTGSERKLLFDSRFGRAPAWSPDGKQLCYHTEGTDGLGMGLFVMDLP